MSNLFNVRRFPRPDQPQPVYTGALALWEASAYPGISDAARNVSLCTASRGTLDVRCEWAPQFGWVEPVVERIVGTWQPAFALELGASRSGARPGLDVRNYEWAPEPAWIPPVVDGFVRTWAGVFSAELASELARARPRFDVRQPDGTPQPAWLFSVQPTSATVDQQWPAILANLGLSYRSLARPSLDVRGAEWAPQHGWIQPVVDGVVRQWVSAFDAELQAFRLGERPKLDVRGPEWSPQPAWIFTNLPGAVTQAQLWPAILESVGLSYRSGDRRVFDVRTDQHPPNAWLYVATDAALGRFAPIWAEQAGSFRTGDRPRLDVRNFEWSPEFSWVQRVIDAVVAKWAPVFNAELGYRTPDGKKLDVRADSAFAELAWLISVISVVSIADFIVWARADDMTVRSAADDVAVQARADDLQARPAADETHVQARSDDEGVLL